MLNFPYSYYKRNVLLLLTLFALSVLAHNLLQPIVRSPKTIECPSLLKNGKSFEAYECVNGNPGSKKLTVMLINGDTKLTDDEYNDFRKFANEQEDGVSKVSINYYVKNGNCYMKSFA